MVLKGFATTMFLQKTPRSICSKQNRWTFVTISEPQEGGGARGGLVQGWESECWGVVGIPLIENKNEIQMFKLTWGPPRGGLMQGWESEFLDNISVINGSWLKARGSCLKTRGSKVMAHGQEKFGTGPHEPWATSLEAWALSHRPWTSNHW